ncbi:MAG: sorbosone dehydrogenase family protein [Hyphomicrobiales bacterium]|jgi:glucose/arabinose dehydrogenase|nr:sorbosone dehydrogenase family protein [Hyphomicrobiales bacterium]
MAFSDVFSRVVEGIGAAAIAARRQDGRKVPQAFGANPTIPLAKPQGSIPTLKMPTAKGWTEGQTPKVASGLKVNAFATGLKHPRWIYVLPNGDVLTAEALMPPEPATSLFDFAMFSTLKRAAAMGESPNRIIRLRDADGDGVAETKTTFLDGLKQPFGMALVGDTFYVGNTDGVVAFSYAADTDKITDLGRRLTKHNGGGHWTRSLLLSPDKTKLYIGVGSLTNIADKGMEVEKGRAAIHELDLATGTSRIFASGLRNPVGLAWEPHTGVLWTVVNERDGLGDETPPDYLTSVREGGFYGWPYCYWGKTVDDRVPQDAALVASAIQPDYALGGHTASLGLCWLPANTLPGFPDGMVIGQHGSWNRSVLSGYKVIFVPFVDGRPSGPSREILSGFLAPDERSSFGRPVGVALGPDGSLLVADDVGNVIWRVTGA